METEQFCRIHFNEPVITCSLKVGRLIGYAEDEQDCYYVVRHIGGDVTWDTAVGPCMTLRALMDQDKVIPKNQADGSEWNNFTRLDHWLSLNGAPKAEHFVRERGDLQRATS